MSEENVDIIRRAWEAYERRDVEAVLEVLDPDVELFPARAVLEGMPYCGHEGFKKFLEDMMEDWEEFETKAEEFRQLDDGRVLVVGRFSATGKSGVELDAPAAWTCEVEGGKIVRVRFYPSAESAISSG
jgi:ketosteroid isomerase-like protein